MKKAISAILVTLLVVCLATAAYADGTPNISVSTVTAQAGDTVTVTVSMSGNPGIMNITIPISYDDTVLEKAQFTGEGTGWVIGENAYWENSEMADSTMNGTLLTLTFTVKEGAEPGTASVTVGPIDAWNINEEQVEFTTTAGGVTIPEPVHEHEFVETSRVEPTATEEGYIEYTCKVCGETKRDTLDATGEDPKPEPIVIYIQDPTDYIVPGTEPVVSAPISVTVTPAPQEGKADSEKAPGTQTRPISPYTGENTYFVALAVTLIVLGGTAAVVAIFRKKETMK